LSNVIEFDHISKRFHVDHERPRSFQERFVQTFRRTRSAAEEVWVLRDVSFTLPQGASLGVIGENGAGKSTLLKLCARVLEPSSGALRIRGRVSALLELGTGFHPDLTGRENVFLYGSLIGIKQTTMRRRFDEIVAFSEIERFIDLPIKFYSSGMYLRLAFAVAIHVDADILLIDEAFAVGDAHFQQKCLNRIRDIQAAGATLLFVSHSANLVKEFCTDALWIQDGLVAGFGPSEDVMLTYTQENLYGEGQQALSGNVHRWGTHEVEVTGVEFLDSAGAVQSRFQTGDPFCARLSYIAHQRIPQPVFGVGIHRDDGTHVNGPNTLLTNYDIPFVEGAGVIEYQIDRLNLLPGSYELSVSVYDHILEHQYDYQSRAYPFWVTAHPDVFEKHGTTYLPSRWLHRAGM
jgi:lipopolysaccharide transport system ATP-binding protein